MVSFLKASIARRIPFIAAEVRRRGYETALTPNDSNSRGLINGVVGRFRSPNPIFTNNGFLITLVSVFTSSTVFTASAKTQSAPQSIYSPYRSIAAFIPSIFAASVRARIKNLSDFLASTAAFILSFASATEISLLPDMWPHLFGKT